MYHYLLPEDIEALLACVKDSSRIIRKEDIHEDYTHDEMHSLIATPEILIEAHDVEEVSRILSYAHIKGIPVTPRGQGTGLVGGSVALCGGIMLSLQKMNTIIELDEENMTLTVESGVLLLQIIEYLQKYAPTLLYPPDPGEKSATIGGNISTNAGGMRAVKYGVTRDYVRALEVVLPDGRIIEVGGKVAKNSSGYSLKDLFIGSEGTLGIITKATLKLIPKPKATVTLLIPCIDLERAIAAVPALLKASYLPTAIEIVQKSVILAASNYLGKPFPDTSADSYIIISCDGPNRATVDQALDEIAQIALSYGAIDALIADTPERQEIIWTARGTFLEAIKASTTQMEECDVVLPRNNIAKFINFCQTLEKKYAMRIMSFGHAGDGNLHLYELKDSMSDTEWEEKLALVFEEMYQKAHELGGKVSGEHGIGYAKKEYLRESEGEVVIELMKHIKTAFDPKGILNPGKVV